MYGFHKRVGLSDNSMKASERKNKSPSEYYNPYFRRGHPNLLWLINKPKNPGKGKGKGGRGKTEDGAGEEGSEDDRVDAVDGEYFADGSHHVPRAISQGPNAEAGSHGTSGPVALTVVQKQLREIQQQQNNISNMINRLRKEHNDLYQQAVAFQTLHDRHESSINAILTFLATVYNRSLDGQGGNLAQMFGNAIPGGMGQNMGMSQHEGGNVVDLSNMQGNNASSMSPMRRPQRLIMAPPSSGQQQGNVTSAATTPGSGHLGSVSTASGSTGNYGARLGVNSPQSGAIEELFDTSPGRSPQPLTTGLAPDSAAAGRSTTPQPPTSSSTSQPLPSANRPPQNQSGHARNISSASAGRPHPQQNMMDMITTTNTSTQPPRASDLSFPDVLSHYETANGASPLSAEQRESMLAMIASSSPGGGALAGLTSTNASNGGAGGVGGAGAGAGSLLGPGTDGHHIIHNLNYTQSELDELMRLQAEQDAKLSQVQAALQPLTPGGSIPGMEGGEYFDGVNGVGLSPGGNLDLDQFLDSGAYYTGDDGTNQTSYETPSFSFGGDGAGGGEGVGGGDVYGEGGGGEGIGTVATTSASASAVPSPRVEDAGEDAEEVVGSSPKRRRKA
jgi:heat shock transcription factor